MVSTGFLRADQTPTPPERMEAGEQWSFDDADAHAHRFLDAIAGGRELEHRLDDPVEHARANSLMLLFSDEVNDVFETYLARMPEPRVEAWRDLIAGGASSEAFGPLTLQEQLDEQQVDDALKSGRKQRTINLAVAAVVTIVGVVGGVVLWNAFIAEDERTEGSFRFDGADEPPEVAALTGGPPVAVPELTVVLTEVVAVEAGEGDATDRVVQPLVNDFALSPGSLSASLFQYAGSGHVALVGPEGFADASCLRASIVTEDLRPLDTVTTGPCEDPVGRTAVIGCAGASAVLIDLSIPEGEVELPEGGTGFADAVRVQIVTDDPTYEVLTVRGTIAVGADESVAVPRFGGEADDELTFDFGDGRVGTCTLTGDLPGAR